MSADTVQLTFACVMAWLAFGLVAGAAAFASGQKGWPTDAPRNYDNHAVMFWLLTVFGVLGAISVLVIFIKDRPPYCGLLIPGQWTRKDAERIRREMFT